MPGFHRKDSSMTRDKGCALRPACLSCNLPMCYLDLPQEQGILQRLAFDVRIMEAQAEINRENPDISFRQLVEEVAALTRATTRSVARSIRRWEHTWNPMNRPE